MKKLLLSVSAIALAISAMAQQRQSSMLFGGSEARVAAPTPAAVPNAPAFKHGHTNGNARTTSTNSGRWYNYTDYAAHVNGTLGISAEYLWNDTASLDAYGSPTQFLHNTVTSMGTIWDPFVPGWNDPVDYIGEMNLTRTNAYTVDSIYISGIYQRNNSKPNPVDTLTIAILYGDGSTGSDLHAVARDTSNGGSWIYTQYGVDTLYYMRMHYDTVNNRADTFLGGMTPIIKQIYLHNTDTSSAFEAVIPVSISVPAGNYPAISLSFKSGDASFTFGDTVFNNDPSASALYKYGMFRPFVEYVESGTTAVFAPNAKTDQNQGLFLLQPAYRSNHVYYPHWFLVSAGTSTASQSQYPNFAFHASCPTCGVLGVNNVVKNISSATAYPNPATSELTVTYKLSSAASASVSLTNMLGQEVATQQVNNTASGQVTFNTSSLASGVYFYAIIANGERYVNKIVIAH